MTGRDRVKSVLARRTPDRVPLDLWGSSSRLHTEFYLRLMKKLGLSEVPSDKIRPGTTTEYVDYRISDHFKVDFRHVHIGKPENFKSYLDKDGNIIDEWGIGRKSVGNFMHISHHPLAEATVDDLEKYPWPKAEDPGRIRGIDLQAKKWHEETGFAITATSPLSGMFFEAAQYLRGAENFLMDLHSEPEFAHRLLEKIADFIIALSVYYIKPVADYVEWIEFTSDYGMQSASFISRDMFNTYFKGHFKRLFLEIKKVAPKAKVFLHSCGAVRELIPDFIDMGLDILNPLQPLATGMDSTELKREFGKDLIFHGGIDIQKAMLGSTKDVEEEVRTRIDILGKGGGYILAPANHIQADVPLENLLRLYEFASEYGIYR